MDFNETHITIAYPTGGGFDSTLYVRGLTIKGTVLTIGTPLRVSVEDTVSKQRYRPKTLSLSNTWVRSTADMEARAETILEAIAIPERRVSLDWYVEDWTDFLALDLSDKVRVEMPTISSDAFVEGIALDLPLVSGEYPGYDGLVAGGLVHNPLTTRLRGNTSVAIRYGGADMRDRYPVQDSDCGMLSNANKRQDAFAIAENHQGFPVGVTVFDRAANHGIATVNVSLVATSPAGETGAAST